MPAEPAHPIPSTRLSVFSTFVLGIVGFAIFLGLSALVVRLFTPENEYEAERSQQRLETRLALDEAALEEMNSYAWVNEDEGVVRIPVSRAADLMIDSLNAKPVQASTVPVPGTPAAEAALAAGTATSATDPDATPGADAPEFEDESALDADTPPGDLASEEASSALFGDPDTESPSSVIDTAPADEITEDKVEENNDNGEDATP